MRIQRRFQKVRPGFPGLLAALAVLTFLTGAGWAWAEEGSGIAGSPEEGEVAQAPQAGQRIEIDAATGERVPHEQMATELSREPLAQERFRMDLEGLVSEPLPGGGVMIDLQGRFQSALVVSINAEGEIETRCELQPALADDEREGRKEGVDHE